MEVIENQTLEIAIKLFKKKTKLLASLFRECIEIKMAQITSDMGPLKNSNYRKR